MKILVTGGYGFVGRALQAWIERVALDEHEWIFLHRNDCDLRHPINFANICHRERPDWIVHLAAKVGGLYENMEKGPVMLIDTVKLDLNVVKAACTYASKGMIGMLSTCIYNPDQHVLSEDDLHNGPPHYSNRHYSYAKRLLDMEMEEAAKRHPDKKFIRLIPTNLYGPGDTSTHVIAELHKKFCAAFLPLLLPYRRLTRSMVPSSPVDKVKVEIKGSGGALRQFLHVDDLCQIIELVLTDAECLSERINVAPPTDVSILHLVSLMQQAWCRHFPHVRVDIYMDGQYDDGAKRKFASSRRLRDRLPGCVFKTLSSGIHELIESEIEKYHIVANT